MESDQKRRHTTRTLLGVSLVLLAALLMSAVPQMRASAVVCKFKHPVAAGETLGYIANLYTVNYLDIAKANNIQAPYVVVAGQVLCIPEGDAPQATGTVKPGKGSKASLTTTYQLDHVWVEVQNFRHNTSYFVRLYAGRSKVSFRLGNFTTDKAGGWKGWFSIPREMPREASMMVCVKNAWTDTVSCDREQDKTFPIIIKSYCSKEGR